jgi:hypothetical protein
MRTITLRKVPTAVMRKILERARERDLSLAKAVISLLEERLGLDSQTRQRSYDDLDHLSGSWSEDEAADFSQYISEQRTIDDEPSE